MFAKLTQAIMGEAGEGQRKGGLGVFFGGILAIVLFGCVIGLALAGKETLAGNLKDIAISSIEAIKVLFGILIVGYGFEYARDAKVGRGPKEPSA